MRVRSSLELANEDMETDNFPGVFHDLSTSRRTCDTRPRPRVHCVTIEWRPLRVNLSQVALPDRVQCNP